MEQQRDQTAPLNQRPSCELMRLICKLRWIGMDDEARKLELMVSTLPPEQRGSVSIGPFGTD